MNFLLPMRLSLFPPFFMRKTFFFLYLFPLEKSFMCIWRMKISHVHASKCHLIRFYTSFPRFIDPWNASFLQLHFSLSLYSALSSNGGVLTINIDKLSVKEAIHNINYVRALAGLDHVGLGPSTSPRKYALLLAELARDRLWNNASLKKLVGGNIVRILREVIIEKIYCKNFINLFTLTGWSKQK